MSEGWTRAESMRKEWRRTARKVTRRIAAKHAAASDTELYAALEKVYPFPPRDKEPLAHRIWLEEVAEVYRAREPEAARIRAERAEVAR